MLLRDRILGFLKKENKTSAQFAEEIGVQPSGISHILSGRNNPSLDFVIKMLEKYPYLSSEWLLFGRGSMYKDQYEGSLFDELNNGSEKIEAKKGNEKDKKEQKMQIIENQIETKLSEANEKEMHRNNITRIIWFYENNTFEEFIPGKG
ncbi:MAG: helix-turn-helix transcriptional regulator [Bacteroidales bacterium]|nr:helix-turn-helix transcriptional regulator [Bacteroidales bacterium]